jgi:GNAT superfamily N-acetyltransferase
VGRPSRAALRGGILLVRQASRGLSERGRPLLHPPSPMREQPPRSITLHPIAAADREFLFRVYASTREEELAPLPWSAAEKEAFLRQQFDAQHAHYQAHYPDATFDVVRVDGEPAGRLYVDRWTREHRIVDIALLPAHRGGGTGTRLLERVVAEADGAGRAVSIHVEAMSPARRWYERMGFAVVEDRGVYLLMERPVSAARAQEKTAS